MSVRTARIELRLTPDEKAGLERQAEGLPGGVSELIRQRALGEPAAATASPVDWDRFEREFHISRNRVGIGRAFKDARVRMGLS